MAEQIPQGHAKNPNGVPPEETQERGCFDFLTKKYEKTDDVVMTDLNASKEGKKEKHTLTNELRRTHSHSTSSSDEEVEEGGERKKKKKKGLEEAIKDKISGKKEGEDGGVPMMKCSEEGNDETGQPEEKKGFLDKIKEKLPGQHKKGDEETQTSPAAEHFPGSDWHLAMATTRTPFCLFLLTICAKFVLQLADDLSRPIFILGDSTADVGTNTYLSESKLTANFPHNGIDFPNSQPTGRFSNGLNSADELAKFFGLKRSPPPFLFLLMLGSHHFKKHFFRCVNFASAGAGVLDKTNSNMTIMPLSEQINQFTSLRDNFTAIIGAPKTEAMLNRSLFFISIGSNDIFNYSPSEDGTGNVFISCRHCMSCEQEDSAS